MLLRCRCGHSCVNVLGFQHQKEIDCSLVSVQSLVELSRVFLIFQAEALWCQVCIYPKITSEHESWCYCYWLRLGFNTSFSILLNFDLQACVSVGYQPQYICNVYSFHSYFEFFFILYLVFLFLNLSFLNFRNSMRFCHFLFVFNFYLFCFY